MKQRLDKELFRRGLVTSRSRAEDIVRRGFVTVDGLLITKTGYIVDQSSAIVLKQKENFVSRAGEKLISVVDLLQLRFEGKTVLDVGSSTGGFTDVVLRNGAKKVIAVDVGTDQMHSRLRRDERVELHEKTDIRGFQTDQQIDIVVVDVSFISLREILPHISKLSSQNSQIVVMVKPQLEVYAELSRSTEKVHPSTSSGFRAKVLNKGVIKNDSMRRKIFKDFEAWAQKYFVIVNKADSKVSGAKGNLERFYLLKKLR